LISAKRFSKAFKAKVLLVQGQVAYTHDGKPILSPMTQADIEKAWKEILKRYLRRLEGFRWLIYRSERQAFEAAVAAYETVLREWVAGFRKIAANDEATLVTQIVDINNSWPDISTCSQNVQSARLRVSS
jgi:hypothetical protein